MLLLQKTNLSISLYCSITIYSSANYANLLFIQLQTVWRIIVWAFTSEIWFILVVLILFIEWYHIYLLIGILLAINKPQDQYLLAFCAVVTLAENPLIKLFTSFEFFCALQKTLGSIFQCSYCQRYLLSYQKMPFWHFFPFGKLVNIWLLNNNESLERQVTIFFCTKFFFFFWEVNLTKMFLAFRMAADREW